jgi:hypothetical protein
VRQKNRGFGKWKSFAAVILMVRYEVFLFRRQETGDRRQEIEDKKQLSYP